MITISYGGTAYTVPNLTEHPYGYDEGDVRRGRAVRRWNITGIVKPRDAAVITGIFEAWNAAKLVEDDPARSGVVGATVAFSGSAPGYSWSSPVACWFVAAPTLPMAGAYVRVNFTLVDAAQSLAALLRQGEEDAEQFAALNLGTLTFGSATVNLTARPDDFMDLPAASLTPAGKHLISGSFAPTAVRRVQGWVTASGLSALETWLATTSAATPAVGEWFPIEWTSPIAKRRADGGVIGTYYDVAFSVVQIR